jgi:hypothetical protein
LAQCVRQHAHSEKTPATPAQVLGDVQSNALREISGIAASRQDPGAVWVHNDGDRALLFKLTADGQLQQRYKLSQTIHDVEDIAIARLRPDGPFHLLIGDIGDNDTSRSTIAVLGCPEPDNNNQVDVKKKKSVRLAVVRSEYEYPDGPHDAEALLVDPLEQRLVVVTKDQLGGQVFVAPLRTVGAPGPHRLERLASVALPQISGGDISSDGLSIVLRNEQTGWWWQRRPDETLAHVWQRAPREIEVRTIEQSPNGEAMALVPDGRAYLTISEGEDQPIVRFKLNAR